MVGLSNYYFIFWSESYTSHFKKSWLTFCTYKCCSNVIYKFYLCCCKFSCATVLLTECMYVWLYEVNLRTYRIFNWRSELGIVKLFTSSVKSCIPMGYTVMLQVHLMFSNIVVVCMQSRNDLANCSFQVSYIRQEVNSNITILPNLFTLNMFKST